MIVTRESVEGWMRRWAAAIRAGDFETGRTLFAEDVISFGTVAYAVSGLEELVAEQWAQVWPKTSEFAFRSPAMIATAGDLAIVAVVWHSLGTDSAVAYARQGRATLTLRQTEQGLLCIHSHFSMLPGTVALK